MSQYLDEVTEEEASCILRALQHKTNYDKTNSGNYCSHEEEFLNKNQTLICRYKRGSTKRRKEVPNFIHSFKNSVQLRFCKDLSLSFLKSDFDKLFSEMNHAQLLFWWGSVLMTYHEKGDCSMYVRLALKFYLKAYKISRFIGSEEDTILVTILTFLECMSEYNYGKELFFGYLKVFMRDLSRKNVSTLIIDIVGEGERFGLNIYSIWKEDKGIFSSKYIEHSLAEPRRFCYLTSFGHVDKRFEGDCKFLKEILSSIEYENMFCADELSLHNCNNIKYRSFQVLYLYARKSYDRDAAKALISLWFTITDPFLAKKQFLSCFEVLCDKNKPLLLKVWKWYKETLKFDKKSRNSPRLLKHYSKCAIRRRLTECCRIYRGIESLPLPKFIKHDIERDMCGHELYVDDMESYSLAS